MKTNCQICGKEYEYCMNCKNTNNWRRYACCPEHYQIVQILTEHREGVIDDKEASMFLANIGADADDNLLEAVSRDVKAIVKRGSSKKASKSKSVEQADE